MSLLSAWNEILDEIIVQIKTLSQFLDETKNNTFNATSAAMATGILRAIKISDLQPGNKVSSFDINVNTASGNIRAKIYDDYASSPNNLLGESDIIPITVTGDVNLSFTKLIEIPQDGIIWLAFENDNSSLNVDITTGATLGTLYTKSHTFGSGPDIFAGTSGTDPFWAKVRFNSTVHKHWETRGTQLEDYFCIVAADNMTTSGYTSKGSINDFKVCIDISYRGADFKDGLTKILQASSDIYDKLHRTSLNGKVRQADVHEITPGEIEEGQNLYLALARIILVCEKAVTQS